MTWNFLTIQDISAPSRNAIAIGPFGSRLKSDRYTAKGVRVVRGTNITSTKRLADAWVYVSQDTAAEFPGCQLKPGDLIFPHRGAIGEVGLVPNDGNQYMISSSLMKLTPDTSKVVPEFLYYYFKSAPGRFELLKNASQVGTPGIGQPLTSLRTIALQLPPLVEQSAITDILSSLDDKIELNRRMNQTLEEIIRTIFKSWFIDFDPVRVKVEGHAAQRINAEVAALFPSQYVTGGTRAVPKGWTIATIRDLIEVKKKNVDPAKSPGQEYYHFSLPAFDAGMIPRVECSGQIMSSKLAVPSTAILVSKLNPHTPRIWFVRPGKEHPAVCSTEFLPVVARNEAWAFAYCMLNSETITTALSSKVKGTSNSHQRISSDDLLDLTIVKPDSNIIGKFSEMFGPVLDLILCNLTESQTLTSIRDLLLPKLLSGEIRLPTTNDPDKLVDFAYDVASTQASV